MSGSGPGAGFLLRDAVRTARRPLAPTLVAVLIAFAAALALFATTGQALATQQRTLDRINSPEGRVITVSDPQGEAGLSPASVAAIERLSGIEWVLGVSPAVDVVNAGFEGGEAVPARRFFGELPAAVVPEVDRSIAIGEGLAGPGLSDDVGLRDGSGAVTSRTLDAVVVAGFRAGLPLAELNESVLVRGDPDAAAVRLLTVWVSVRDVAQLERATAAVRGAVVADEPGALRVTTSVDLAALSTDLVDELARSSRATITGLLLAVAVLIGAVQFGRVAGMSRDIGRRRALGASRTLILLQVLLAAALSATAGALLGGVAGVIVVTVLAGAPPPLGFTVAVVLLVVLAALAGAVAPAVRAARLDPVAILRVP